MSKCFFICITYCLYTLTTAAPAGTPIFNMWVDDFNYDLEASTGWNDNHEVTGSGGIYHGDYFEGMQPIQVHQFLRYFVCAQNAINTVYVQSSVAIDCDCTENDFIQLTFDGNPTQDQNGRENWHIGYATTQFAEDGIPNGCGEKWNDISDNTITIPNIPKDIQFKVSFDIIYPTPECQMMIYDISIICAPPTQSPTVMPSKSPSFAPIPSGPTPSPVFSTSTMYVAKSGTDSNNCISTAPCATINYAYDCLNDNIANALCNIHHGNGIIDIDGYSYYLERLISIGNGNLRIFGDGINSMLYMNLATPTTGVTWFECTYFKCWIGLEDLVLASDRTSTSDTLLKMNGGTMEIKNVIFDGNNFQININGDAGFSFSNSQSTVIFDNCTFTHLNTIFEFKSGVIGTFINCRFIDNNINDLYHSTPFITIDQATVTFTDCVFQNNTLLRDLISVTNGAQLIINNTIFTENEAGKDSSSLYHPLIVGISGVITKSYVDVTDSHFTFNNDFDSMFKFLIDSDVVMNIDRSIFSDNSIRTDIEFATSSNGQITMNNCQFLRGNKRSYDYSLYLSHLSASIPAVNRISNTIFDDYWTNFETINIYYHWSDTYIENVQFRNILGRGLRYKASANILTVDNCTFYNITKQSNTGTANPWSGGAIYYQSYGSGAPLNINNSRFELCSSVNGGALYIYNPPTTSIFEKMTFHSNYASTACDLYVYTLKDPFNLPGPHYATKSYGGSQANSILLRYGGPNNVIWDLSDWTIMNSTGGSISSVIYVNGAGFRFYNNVLKYNLRPIVEVGNYYSINAPLSFTVDIQNCIFQNNYGGVLVYPSVVESGAIININNNVFDGNGASIFNLVLNENITSGSGTTISVYNIKVRNYNKPSDTTLFTISTSNGDCISSMKLLNTEIYFTNINFLNNIDTQFLKTTCVSFPVTYINVTNNSMPTTTNTQQPILSTPMFLFAKYTEISIMDNIIAINNAGVMIAFSFGITQFMHHTVRYHYGIYLIYLNQHLFSAQFNSILLNSVIENSDSTLFSAASAGLVSFYASDGLQLTNTWIYLSGVTFLNNTGTLIKVSPGSLSTTTPYTSCPLTPSGLVNNFDGTTFRNNHINTGYLIDIRGVNMWFDLQSIVWSNNYCGLYSTCLSLTDGWFTFPNFDIGVDLNTNFITFGHETTAIPQYPIHLCFQSLNNSPKQIVEYLSFINLNVDSQTNNGERVTFLPLPCDAYSVNHSAKYLQRFTDYSGVSKLDYFTDAANIFNDHTVCNETDCQITCNGSISCFKSAFYCGTGVNNIECGGEYACTDTRIYSDSVNGTYQVSILCDASLACSTAEFIMVNVEEFKLVCTTTDACNQLTVNISGENTLSEIYCHQYQACESLTVYTENPNTTLFLYEYSSDIAIHSPFGYINDPDTNEQNLFCGDPNHFIDFGYSYATAYDAVSNQYSSGTLPCEDVIFFCNNYTDTSANCTMMQQYVTNDKLPKPFYQCYPTFLTDLVSNLCLGTCPNSPTQSPTAAPSQAPTPQTSNPTTSPSDAPTFSPSISPTTAPTAIPSTAPSLNPTIVPSVAPTSPPTLAPSISPSIAPTNAPTIKPTPAPSFSPSIAPSLAPTLLPTFAPTVAPSIAPTINPTQTPTEEPTFTPSNAPTYTPSVAPSLSPTMTPTRVPTTSNPYDTYLPIKYILKNLTNLIKANLASKKNKFTSAIEQIIERGYFNPQYLKYHSFEVVMTAINDDKIEDITNNSWVFWGTETDPLYLECEIHCMYDKCVLITSIPMDTVNVDTFDGITNGNADAGPKKNDPETSDNCNSLPSFQPIVQCNLAKYFKRAGVGFELYTDMSDLSSAALICTKDCGSSESFDYVLIGILSFLGLMTLISILAFLYNRQFFPTLPGFSPVDDAQWAALLIFGVQAWDFVSDVNLAIEIWGDLNGNGIPDKEEEDVTFKDANLLVLISAIGSSVSIILPYIVNLAIAANIKRLIRKNNAAKAYFQYYAAVYVLFVVLSGGAYPALAVVSSNIFGLIMFNSGLTRHELKKLSKIKVFGTIVLENLPQLVCQILYSYVLGYPSQTTQLAFCASLLSVTASTLSYWIEKNAADTIAVQYYLAFQCEQKRGMHEKQDTEILPYDDIGDEEDPDQQITTVASFGMSSASVIDSDDRKMIKTPISNLENKENLENYGKLGITEGEKTLFNKNKGLKWKLSSAVSEVFGISEKNLEIGYVQITKYGIIIHIVHYVYQTDLEELEDIAMEDSKKSISIGAAWFTQQLYGTYMKEMNQIFRTHFQVNNDFNISYHKRYPKKDNKSMGTGNVLNENNTTNVNSEPLNEKRTSVLHEIHKKMKSLKVLPGMNEEGFSDISMSDEEKLGDGGAIEMTQFDTVTGNKQLYVKKKLNNVLSRYKFKSNKDKKEFLMKWIEDDEYDNDYEQKLEEQPIDALPIKTNGNDTNDGNGENREWNVQHNENDDADSIVDTKLSTHF
eukprot:135556_1